MVTHTDRRTHTGKGKYGSYFSSLSTQLAEFILHQIVLSLFARIGLLAAGAIIIDKPET